MLQVGLHLCTQYKSNGALSFLKERWYKTYRTLLIYQYIFTQIDYDYINFVFLLIFLLKCFVILIFNIKLISTHSFLIYLFQICCCDESDCGTCQAEKEAVSTATSWFDTATCAETYTKVDPSQSMIYLSEMQLHTDTSDDKR